MKNIYKRVSSRKFTDEKISNEDIEEIIKAATHAPSATFCQNSYFVVVKDKDKINSLSNIVSLKSKEISKSIDDESMSGKFLRASKYHVFFKDAPVFILVYMTKYEDRFINLIGEKLETKYVKDNFDFYNPGLQSVSASMQNICLAATSLGIGTCWMTGFLYAEKEINDFLGIDSNKYRLVCGTPIGKSIDFNREPLRRKPIEEFVKYI